MHWFYLVLQCPTQGCAFSQLSRFTLCATQWCYDKNVSLLVRCFPRAPYQSHFFDWRLILKNCCKNLRRPKD